MLTSFDKALVPIFIGIVTWLNQKYGLHLPADDASLSVFISAVSSIIVFFIPNKAA